MWEMWLGRGELDVGCADVDERHREIFRLFEKVYGEAFSGVPREPGSLLPWVERLCAAILEHFDVEERLMEAHAYPGRREHRAAHDSFREEMRFILEAARAGRLGPAAVTRIAGEAPEWVATHIREHDVRLGRFLAERNGTGASR